MTKKEKTILANRLEADIYYYYVALGRSVAYYDLGITRARATEDCVRANGILHSTAVIINDLLGTKDIFEAIEVFGIDIQSIKERALAAVEDMKTHSKFNERGEGID